MPTITIQGRLTRGGSYLSAGRPHRNLSRSGRSWKEHVHGPIGHQFIITRITHDGQHGCFKAKITGPEAYEVIEELNDPHNCQFCTPTNTGAP